MKFVALEQSLPAEAATYSEALQRFRFLVKRERLGRGKRVTSWNSRVPTLGVAFTFTLHVLNVWTLVYALQV